MQCFKEEVAGQLYIASQYSYGQVAKACPAARSKRREITSEYKRKLNTLRRKMTLMQLISLNFVAGKDLFIYLGYDYEPTEKQTARALAEFHRKMKAFEKRRKVEYKFVLVSEEHNREGEEVRLHHHLVVTGLSINMLGRIREMWGQGSVDVRVLRDFSEGFEDLANYFLKEKKAKGKRAYNTSRNMIRPDKPIRTFVSDKDQMKLPDGVKIIQSTIRDNDFGRYEIAICKVIDINAFEKYIEKQKRREAYEASLRHYNIRRCR